MDHFLFETVAKIAEFVSRTVVFESANENRVAADERSRNRTLHADGVAALEDRLVASFWKLDHDFVVLSFFAIVADEARSEAARLDTNERVHARIEGRFFAEHFDADEEFLQLVAAAAKHFFDDEGEKTLQTIDLAEGLAGEDSAKLLADLFVRLFAQGESCTLHRHRVTLRRIVTLRFMYGYRATMGTDGFTVAARLQTCWL